MSFLDELLDEDELEFLLLLQWGSGWMGGWLTLITRVGGPT